MESSKSLRDLEKDPPNNDELNVGFIFRFFLRNIKNISLFSAIFFFVACIYSLILKREWSGEFQIVLNDNSENLNFESVNPAIKKFIDTPKSNLKTQVQILQSPSVLMPIYDYLVAKKTENSEVIPSFFSKWKKNNLKIRLESGTSILNISYKDTNKKLIVPVLNKISNAYQTYSQKNKKRNQQLTKNYLSDQIALFKTKSSESLREAQKFAMDEDLIFIESRDNIIDLNNNSKPFTPQNSSFLNSNSGQLENLRVDASNEIKRINEQIKKIEGLNDYEQYKYFGTTIPILVEEGLPKKLVELELKLADLRIKYNENDRSILNIEEEIKALVKIMKDRTIAFLEQEKIDAEAIMKASTRPKGVLMNYKELLRNAARDQTTLISLENKLRVTELEEAKFEDPWELITNPTLLKFPVAPSRKKIGLIGLFFGFIVGVGYSFFKEKKSNKIFELEILKELLNIDYIGNLILTKNINSNFNNIYIKENLEKKAQKNLNLIFLESEFKYEIKEFFKKKEFPKNVYFLFGLEEIKNCNEKDKKVLCINLDKVSYSQIEALKKYIHLYDLVIDGFLTLE